ncbi:MAG: HepT-like ribonuclease domain-containing protein [Stellaceae bacterium]
MRSDAALSALHDIAHHIDLAAHFAAGFDYETFRDDLRTVYAVTRCLEIISEASRRLPNELKARHPAIPWKEMAGAGDVYRHDYEDVGASYVWRTVQNHLPPLRAVIQQELAAFDPPRDSGR